MHHCFMLLYAQAQLAASELLGSSADYQRWLHVYVQTLVALAQANDTLIDFTAANPVSSPLATMALARLHELTASLVPALHSFQPNSETVCGLDRCATLRSLLPALASGRQTQRIAETVLRRVKEWEQRNAERESQRLAEADLDGEEVNTNGMEPLPALFSSSAPARVVGETNGFHPSSLSTPSSSGVSPINGLSSGSASTVSKHHQLEQRLMGGRAQQVHTGLNGTHDDDSDKRTATGMHD